MNNSGIRLDYLSVSFDGDILDYNVLMDICKKEAQKINGIPMYGLGYEFDDFRLYLQADYSNSYPIGLLVFNHELLWVNDYEAIQEIIMSFEIPHHVTRADLSCLFDFDFYNSEFQDVEKIKVLRFGKNKKMQPYFNNDKIEAWYFGDLKKRTKLLRIYDKKKEVEQQSSKWYMINDEWDNVINVEFELRRDFLRLRNINKIDELLNNIEELWRYLTKKFISFRYGYIYTEFWSEVMTAKKSREGGVIVREWVEKKVDIKRVHNIVRGFLKTMVKLEGKALTALRIENMLAELEERDDEREKQVKIEKETVDVKV